MMSMTDGTAILIGVETAILFIELLFLHLKLIV